MGLDDFLVYLKKEKNKSKNTIEAYSRDINSFSRFLSGRDVGLEEASNTDVVAYLMDMKTSGKSKATVNRRLASLRAFYRYLIKIGAVKTNPTDDIKSPKIERNQLDYLTVEEVDVLLSQPDDSIKGLRDKAMLEVLYATGIRVSELIELKLKDINLRMGFLTCSGNHGKARIVPMGALARTALENYLMRSRRYLMRDKATDDPESPLFVNFVGDPFTRQGFWKVMRGYGTQAGLEGKITPQVLRNSFAVHMLQNGADLKSISELLGHEDISATEIYLTVTKTRIKDVYDRTHPRA